VGGRIVVGRGIVDAGQIEARRFVATGVTVAGGVCPAATAGVDAGKTVDTGGIVEGTMLVDGGFAVGLSNSLPVGDGTGVYVAVGAKKSVLVNRFVSPNSRENKSN
jgi:hypothetical protein